MPARPEQLGDRRWPAAAPCSAGRAMRSALQRMSSRPIQRVASRWRITGSSSAPLAARDVERARRARARSRAAGRASTTPRSKPSVPIATCQPVARLADDDVGARAGAGEEDLVELRGAGDLDDRADLDAGLVHRHEQVREALVPLRAAARCGRRTKHQSATWASDVHTFWPLMTHSSPSSTARVCDVGEVGAGVGLGVALAPQLRRRAGSRAGTARCCSGVPKAISVGPSSPSPMWPTRAGRAGAGVLLVEDDLLEQRQPAAAVLRGPAEAGPAVPRRGAAPRPGARRRPRARAGAAPAAQRRRTRRPGCPRATPRTSARNASSAGRG